MSYIPFLPVDWRDELRKLYWETDTPEDELVIRYRLSSHASVVYHAGPVGWDDICCKRCHRPLEIKTRNELKQLLARRRPALCFYCQIFRRDEEVEETRLTDLAEMPYSDYLQTPEWQEVRKAALERANYRCQVCNAAVPLDVHHRTYERRGHEHANDVIALCRECHEVFHHHRQIARPD
jgi:hypothetical protein